MRIIDTIVLHCSATREGQPFNVAAIRQMHLARRFDDIGYHYVIGLQGERWEGRPIERIGAHVAGHNKRSIGICYIGGIGIDGRAKDTRTPAQIDALEALVRELRDRFPATRITGHRDLSPDRDGDGKVEPHEWLKMCPCFDTAAWCRSVGIHPDRPGR